MGPPDCSHGNALLRLISANKCNGRCAALRMPIRLLCDACVYSGPGLQMHIQWLLAKRGLASRIYLPNSNEPQPLGEPCNVPLGSVCKNNLSGNDQYHFGSPFACVVDR